MSDCRRLQWAAGLSDAKSGQEQAKSLLFKMAHEPFRIPGDANFALGGLVSAPATTSDGGAALTLHP